MFSPAPGRQVARHFLAASSTAVIEPQRTRDRLLVTGAECPYQLSDLAGDRPSPCRFLRHLDRARTLRRDNCSSPP